MKDEFLIYLEAKIKDRLIISFDNTDLLLWGTRRNSKVKLLGITLNIGCSNLRTVKKSFSDPKNQITHVMKFARLLANASSSTFFAIAYSLSGDDYFVVTEPTDPLNWQESVEVNESKMPLLIQTFFGTRLRTLGTAKAVNKATSDWFHDWARANLPLEYVRVNIDGLILDKEQRPSILLETKRSFYSVDSWEPWRADARNYYLQNLLATKSGLKFWTVYHKKGISVGDKTRIALFIISKVTLGAAKWIIFRRIDNNARKVLKLVDE